MRIYAHLYQYKCPFPFIHLFLYFVYVGLPWYATWRRSPGAKNLIVCGKCRYISIAILVFIHILFNMCWLMIRNRTAFPGRAKIVVGGKMSQQRAIDIRSRYVGRVVFWWGYVVCMHNVFILISSHLTLDRGKANARYKDWTREIHMYRW